MEPEKTEEYLANKAKWKKATVLSGTMVIGGVVQMVIQGVWTATPFPVNLLILIGILIGLTFLITLWWKEI